MMDQSDDLMTGTIGALGLSLCGHGRAPVNFVRNGKASPEYGPEGSYLFLLLTGLAAAPDRIAAFTCTQYEVKRYSLPLRKGLYINVL